MPDAYKRIYELNPELTLSLSHNIAVDKNGNVSATKITITELYNIIIAQLEASGKIASAGNIKMHGSNVLPDGWLWCDHASYERVGIYADLFSDIGTTFGSVDGDHFNVPEFTDKIARGNTPGAIGGSDDAVVVDHDHGGVTGGNNPGTTNFGVNQHLVAGNTAWGHNTSPFIHTHSIPSEGVSGIDKNIPAYLGVNFIIKY